MRQQDMLRAAMKQSSQTRQRMAESLGVSLRTLDKWLLPENSQDFRRMPETARRLLAAQYGVRGSSGLSKPYDWSDPAMTDEALILAVLRRAEFSDLVQLCIDQGLDRVKPRVETALALVPAAERPILERILVRMLGSIEIALTDESGQRSRHDSAQT
jgi:transcriptional regulator with XRE-family HTH domain